MKFTYDTVSFGLQFLVAVGIDAVFLEVHPDPARALSDAESGLSERRRGVQQVMDALAGELGRRYREGEADVAALLADEGR